MPTAVIIVPCYNEAERLDGDVFVNFAEKHPNITILFVNDGSTDATQNVIEQIAGRAPERLRVHALEHNSGKAEAVRQGMERAFEMGPDMAGFWDADLATPLDEIPNFMAAMERDPEFDFLLGSRIRLLGREVRRSEMRHYLGRIFATVVSLVLRLAVYDTQCGAKLFRVNEKVMAIFSKPFISRWVFDVELLARYIGVRKAHGEKDVRFGVCEIPLNVWRDVAGSKLRTKDFLRSFLDVAKIALVYRKTLRR